MRWFLKSDERGSVAVIGALSLTALIGMGALAVELGDVYQTKVQNQRAADVAALGTAMSYVGNSSTDIQGVAASLATLNNVSTNSTVTASLITNGDGNKAVQVSVTTAVPLLLGRAVSSVTSINAGASAVAEIKPVPGNGCIVALKTGGSGVTVSGGGGFNATNCDVISAAGVSGANCQSPPLLEAEAIYLVASSVTQPSSCGSEAPIQTTPKASNFFPNSNAPTDTIKTGATMVNATATLGQVQAMTAPAAPTPVASNTAITVTSATATEPAQAYTSATITTSTVNFTGGATNTTFTGNMTFNGANTINLGAGTYIIDGNITAGWGATTTFNTTGTVNIIVGGTLGGGGSMVFGNANVTVLGGVSAGSYSLTFGTGVMQISGGISGGGGSTISIGNSGSAANPLTVVGGVTMGGGSTLTIGSGGAKISGTFNFTGSTLTIAAGAVYVGGDFIVGNGATTANGVSFIIGGTGSSSTGFNNSGYMKSVTAPATGATLGIPNVLFAAPNLQQFSIQNGGSGANTVAGLIYLPNAAFAMSGSQQLTSTSCLELVAATISWSGGSGGFTTCPNLGLAVSTGGTVALVQ